jgi:rhodanese-related sulfurtransferase
MEVTRITVDEVRERLARGEPLAIVDARSAEAWGQAETQIPGSIRVPPDDVAGHAAAVPRDRAVVAYCT